ncbi:lysophospholipid acyltransferase family protein [Haloimpatiens lingqiaonensis]|uniref:lysophospholipid acyltransferase family protein n=1 Tax=Haloimpatiens lingqiaonensis TaxID=1380675 RepID=UPI0010FD8B73|nr:lysophospholipid acyltransferase family protein [Haloimpatiens lingqiaonensis]
MIKLFWYTYFVIYLLLISIIGKIKLFILGRKSQNLADEYAYSMVQKASKHILKKSKTETEVSGLENIPKETCVFMCNHQAIFDGFLLMANIDKITGFIAKKEITKLPLIRSWLRAIHSVFIDRSNPREGLKALNEGVENLKKGYSLIIFPEGTRSLKSQMGEFKKGSMKLALKAGVPIVPVTVDGTYNVLEVGNKVRGNKVKMIVHEPIYLENLSSEDKKNLSESIHHIIEKAL